MKTNSFAGWFKGIKGRLLLAAFMPVIGFTLMFVIAFNGINKLSDLLASAHESIIPNLSAIGEMRQARNKFSYKVIETVDFGSDPKIYEDGIKSVDEGIKEFAENYDKYTKAPFLPGEEAMHEKAKPSILELMKIMETISADLKAKTPEKNKQAIALLEGRYTELGNNVRDFSRTVSQLYNKTAVEAAAETKETKKSVFNLVILVTLLAAFAIFGVLLWIAAKISSSVGSIADRLTGASTQVATAVEQLNEAGNSLSQSSTEAAASLEETVAALEELTSMVQMNSDNAKQAAALSVSSREAAESGEEEIKTLITSMTEISQSSKKIEEIISVIDDIAFQTNLLALNAAVEAARAGEQGKGFAVVAEAVRALAQRSASSAKDISSLIKESVDQIDRGSEIADKSGTVLANIVNSIKKVSDLNNEIAAASSEQTTGIQQISKAMNQLDQSSQSNAASAEEIAATSGEISSLATNTQDLTVELNRVVLGGDVAAPAAVHHETKKTFVAKKNNVVPLRKTASTPPPSKASETIPFDEDTRGKVGSTDGF